jgi:aspartate kinase
LANAGVSIRMINQGSSELNIIVGVPTEQYEKATNAIYEAFADKE